MPRASWSFHFKALQSVVAWFYCSMAQENSDLYVALYQAAAAASGSWMICFQHFLFGQVKNDRVIDIYIRVYREFDRNNARPQS